MVNEKGKIIAYIQKKGLRLTSQREKIINTLIVNCEKHLSAVEIYDSLKKEDDVIGMATIYRTLDLLENEDIVMKRDFNSGTSRYELIINRPEHNHLICKKCGKIIEVPDMLPDNTNEILLNQKDFRCLNHSIKFYGYCKECQEEGI